jgi:hypothetical protein
MTAPYVNLDIEADVTDGGTTVRRSDSISGIGDIVLMPVMLNQNLSPDFNINYRLGIYVPTGRYEPGRLANTGKNFWTIEPQVGFMSFGQKNGIEASARSSRMPPKPAASNSSVNSNGSMNLKPRTAPKAIISGSSYWRNSDRGLNYFHQEHKIEGKQL